MAFLYPALAIILVCVFKHLEKLPLGAVLKEVTARVLEFGRTAYLAFVFPFQRYIYVKLCETKACL